MPMRQSLSLILRILVLRTLALRTLILLTLALRILVLRTLALRTLILLTLALRALILLTFADLILRTLIMQAANLPPSDLAPQPTRSHPRSPPEPTHNHIFLCGGLGEWMHRSLGGITPTSDGYATVEIAPAISPHAGPSAANLSLLTIRGRIECKWKRGGTGSGPLLHIAARVPTSVAGTVLLPLLLADAARVALRDVESDLRLWPPPPADLEGASRHQAALQRSGVRSISIEPSASLAHAGGEGEGDRIRVEVLAGGYSWVVEELAPRSDHVLGSAALWA